MLRGTIKRGPWQTVTGPLPSIDNMDTWIAAMECAQQWLRRLELTDEQRNHGRRN